MEQKTAPRHHFKPKRPQTLGSCLTIFSRSLLLLASVSIWVTGCGKGDNITNVIQSALGGGGATGDGGGGQGVMCGKDATNPDLKNRLFVRDVYEAIVDKDLKMKSVSGPSGTDEVSDEALQILANSLKTYFGPASYSLAFTKAEFWKRLVKATVFLEEDHELLASQDANSPLHFQTGCKAVQIAYWDESSGVQKEHRLYVNRKHWRSLDQLNKIALLAHEVFYEQARKSGYKNSDTVRAKIGQLLSQEGLAPLFKEWVPAKNSSINAFLPASAKGFKTCEGFSPDDPEAKLYFYQYEGKDLKQHFTFPVVSSNSINSAYLQSASFEFDPSVKQALATATDALYFQTSFHDDSLAATKDLFLFRWYSNSYLIRNFESNMNRLTEDLTFFVGKEPILWTGHLMSSPTPITVSLVNTMADWGIKQKQEPRTREEQIEKIHQDLIMTLSSCGMGKAEAEESIALLHNEVKTSVKSGKYPHNFPLWNKRLREFSEKFMTHDSGYSKCDLTSDDMLTSKYPAYLYSLKLKTDTIGEGQNVLGEWIYKSKPTEQIPLGKMRLTQGSNKLDFDLRCYDFATSYAEFILKNEKKPKALTFSRKITSNLPEAMPDYSVEEINLMGRFMNFLSPNTDKDQKDFSKFIELQMPNDDFKYDRPEQVRAFLADLQAENHVAFDMCSQKYTSDYNHQNIKTQNSSCLIATMASSGHRYMLYFAYSIPNESGFVGSHPDLPYLEFVQLLP